MQPHSAFAASNETLTATHAGVAASILLRTTYMVTNNDDDLDIITLANGVIGDEKVFALKTIFGGDSLKIVPNAASGFTQITFADSEVGAGCIMSFDGTSWHIVGNNGGTIA